VIARATVHKSCLNQVARSCHLLHKPNVSWPTCEYVPPGQAHGVLTPIIRRALCNPPLSVGVFNKTEDSLELVWLDGEDDQLNAVIGEKGGWLRQAIGIAEVARICQRDGLRHKILATNEKIEIRIEGVSDMQTMPKGTIVVSITKDGGTKVGVEGGSGTSCTDLTRELEGRLGTSTEKAYKQEYNDQPQHLRVSD
jgi:hypothetical protein